MIKLLPSLSLAALVLAVMIPGLSPVAAADDAGEAGMNTGAVSAAEAGAPIYPGGKPINGGLVKMTLYSKVTGTVVTFSTPDSFAKVFAFYRRAVPAGAVISETGSLSYTKSDGSKIDIVINTYPGHTNYTINNTYKKP